jgi:hypothetical protein
MLLLMSEGLTNGARSPKATVINENMLASGIIGTAKYYSLMHVGIVEHKGSTVYFPNQKIII